MSVFSKMRDYNMGSWEVIDTEKLSKAELKAIDEIVVVEKEQEWGISTSMCFIMNGGKKHRYCPLSRDSSLEEGDVVDPTSVTFLILSKEGEDDITRCDGAILEEPKKKGKGKKKAVVEDDEEEDEE